MAARIFVESPSTTIKVCDVLFPLERHFICLISDSRLILVLVIQLNEDDILHFVIDFYPDTISSSARQRWFTV